MTTPNNPPLPEPDYVHGDWRGDAYTPGALRAYGDARAAAAPAPSQASEPGAQASAAHLMDKTHPWTREHLRRYPQAALDLLNAAKATEGAQGEAVAVVTNFARSGEPLLNWLDRATITLGDKLYAAPPARKRVAQVPPLDYHAAVAAAFASHLKAPQGTATCVAFTLGAEWFREQYLAHVGVELEKE